MNEVELDRFHFLPIVPITDCSDCETNRWCRLWSRYRLSIESAKSGVMDTTLYNTSVDIKSKSNQMSLPNVRFAVKTTSVTPPSITGRYQCTTQADRDVGYR